MNKTSDLLASAIADAKAVRETAIENAKIALQEAFNPRIQSMLSAKLSEELDDEDEMEGFEDEDGLGAEDGLGDEFGAEGEGSPQLEPGDSVGQGSIEADIDGDGESPDAIDMVIPDEGEGEASPEGELDLDAPEGDLDLDAPEEDEDDLELEAIIKELEGDMDSELDESIDDIIERIMSEEYEEEGEEGTELQTEEEEIEEIDDPAAAEDGSGQMNENARNQLKEAYSTIQSLRSTLQEVNLLNAKLLYTNKLFRAFELDESQKLKVVENFDRANSSREVKLVFSTLAESISKTTKEKKPTRKPIKEHRNGASRSAGTTRVSERVADKILTEGNEQVARFKKLANIK